MKLGDISPEKRVGTRVKTPKGVVGYFASAGNCVVMLSKTEGIPIPVEGKRDETRNYPQVVEYNEDVLEWDVVDEPINCHVLTGHRYTMCINEIP